MTETRYLPALDGLRALSVLAVIGFHAELAPLGGGFLGVEVFFVVSGYLITSLLLLERRATGRIAMAQFWGRRARRLLPALFALLLTTLVASMTLASGSLAQTRGDACAALFYVSNWWQVLQHHSYFMAIERPPLLQHLWSLAVEEQFYLIWPPILALIAGYRRSFVGPLALLGGVASALWMAHLFDPNLDSTRVYVGSDTRLSGLLFGSALAAVMGGDTALAVGSALALPGQRVLRQALSALGLGTLVWAFLHFDNHSPFVYRGGLALIDLASCALISGLVTSTVIAKLLGAAPCAWLGRRSYGLYLWHWPIFALTRPDFDLYFSRPRVLVLRLALTFVISEACYRGLELPIRRGALGRLVRSRPVAFAASAACFAGVSGVIVLVSGARLASARAASMQARSALTGAHVGVTTPRAGAAPSPTTAFRIISGVALDPAWPKTLTLLSDSVALSLSKSLPAALPSWKVEVLGRPALMVKQVVPEFLNARGVGSVVVVGLAYNSLFEKDRRNFQRWSDLWDRNAEKLLSDLKACGAKKIIWLTLRDPSPEWVTDTGRDQYERYAWFFPYVNERIRALAARHPELGIADWQAVSNVPDITKDLIHLNPAGVALMTETVRRAIYSPDPPP